MLDAINTGSPPQVRGKPRRLTQVERIGRITPAGAGKTSCSAAVQLVPRDHPRRCGENLRTKCGCISNPGSPPQVRGKLMGYHYTDGVDRITPAGAGKTVCFYISKLGAEDHPRRCGENKSAHGRLASLKGSPPQVRGKPHRDYIRQKEDRITPAGAGKTLRACGYSAQRRDHPRRCGENANEILLCACGKGSPPQVRGKLLRKH